MPEAISINLNPQLRRSFHDDLCPEAKTMKIIQCVEHVQLSPLHWSSAATDCAHPQSGTSTRVGQGGSLSWGINLGPLGIQGKNIDSMEDPMRESRSEIAPQQDATRRLGVLVLNLLLHPG